MVKCSFCGALIPKGTGKMFVKKDGVVFFFCSNKCEENMLQLGRTPQKTKWTALHAQLKSVARHTRETKKEPKAAKKGA
ncbi:MAG: 50S ribosomal protein L24e [Candidatus Diapherotrites archaeon]|nr:50S ribosomal protein L24e [Candidatus Diapherotrites archaeon]